MIQKSNILTDKSILIIHRDSKNNDLFPSSFKILEEKRYGISKIIFGKF